MARRITNSKPLNSGGGGRNNAATKSKRARTGKSSGGGKSSTKLLDAFALAEEQVSRGGKAPRARGEDDDDEILDPSDRRAKRQRGRDAEGEEDDDDDGDEDGNDDDAEERPRKKNKRGDVDDFGSDEDMSDGADGGEEWHEGVDGADEDSDIDSDEAFGESDEERFAGFTFRGSGKKGRKGDGSDAEEEDDDDDDDGESLGSDAIDLADALDQVSDDESEEDGSGSGSDDDEDSSSAESVDVDDDDNDDDDEGESKLETLRGLIAGFGDDDDGDKNDEDAAPRQKAKVTLKDLGLAGVKDPHIKASLKLMNKEEKAAAAKGKKLEVPLARRQQDKLVRSAAYEQSKATLDRWTETVKHNRRADHLVFPLAQNAHDAGLDQTELMPVDQKRSTTELEQAILSIIEESGLGESAKKPNQAKKDAGDDDGDDEEEKARKKAVAKELERERRRERELFSREQARAKRLKKIKSKAWRRVHRREQLRGEEATKEAMLEAGELDSDEDREAEDRRHVLERVGVRHRESKWAKLGKKAGRAVWDEDFRAGLTDIARRDEELRRRIEGRAAAGAEEDDDEDEDDGGSDDDDGDDRGASDKRRLLAKLDKAAAYGDDDEPASKLMQMRFMQRAEETRKRENDELVKQIRRELDSDNGEEDDDVEEAEVGRRQYGMTKKQTVVPGLLSAREDDDTVEGDAEIKKPRSKRPQSQTKGASSSQSFPTSIPLAGPEEPTPPGGGAWSQVGQDAQRRKKARSAKIEELDLSAAAAAATLLAKPQKKKTHVQEKEKRTTSEQHEEHEDDDDDDDNEEAFHLPTAIRDQELIKRAFAGEDVVADFEREKQALVEEEGDQVVDESLPGWGNWVGEGVSRREKKRQAQAGKKFVRTIEGVQEKKRKDFALKKVIISEKHVRKNDKYMASSLPFPFESRQQYEGSLRQPVGPEWQTKQVFQDATKPRVIVKQGVITPMSKPMY